MERSRAVLNYPSVRLASGRVMTWERPEDYEIRWDLIAEREGWHHSTLDSVEVIQAGADKVHIAAAFSRWTAGSRILNGREAWLEGVSSWYEEGWRVEARQNEILEILIREDLAFTRRLVSETYLGPGGETSTSAAALAEVWVRANDSWKLWRVDARPLDRP